ncbi:MAG: metabolite traffic protein EboE [Cyclobacteriaceae bacterium]
MRIADYHLTYCTNIHPGESWESTFKNLKDYIPSIKSRVSPDQAFGIGLRLSDEASRELTKEENLLKFKYWLEEIDSYIFTLNGFPFGGFHRRVVKDEVHHPDWTTPERKDYTIRLFDILSRLLPEGMDGGISTSPLSYRHWHKTSKKMEEVMEKSCQHLMEVVHHLYGLKKNRGQALHLDIEPEPDGVIENSRELIAFFRDWLVPKGSPYLMAQWDIGEREAERIIKDHIRVCYDVCHFAVAFENHQEVIAAFEKEGIKTGKIQISAALKVIIPKEKSKRMNVEKALLPFVESTYLHQVVGRDENGRLTSYPDLPDALTTLADTKEIEWRIHFHVPVFLDAYGHLESTQKDIIEVLGINHLNPFTYQLEVETYTWEVLPENIHLSLDESISRELEWVKSNIE